MAARALREVYSRCPGVVFDAHFGTSTGSIVAAIRSAPNPMPPDKIIQWYYNEGPKIFNEPFWHRPGDLVGAKYSTAPLYASLQECIGLHSMSECAVPFICATVDADTIRPVWLDQYTPWAAWECAAASSSAQTYFPAFRKAGVRYIDGGNFANNPARHAANWARQKWPNEPIVVIHLGTGVQGDPNPLPEGGILQWASRVFGEMSNLQDEEAWRDVGFVPNCIGIRADVPIPSFPGMDDASKYTLDAYIGAAESEIARNPQLWSQIKEALQ